MRIAFVTFLLLSATGCASDSKPGVLSSGFFCGGMIGASCPPASVCDSDDCGADVADCGSGCRFNQRCDPEDPVCPAGFDCDPSERFCLPARTCDFGADCAADEHCTTETSKGICVPIVEAPGASCTATEDCPWPLMCLGGERTCEIPCSRGDDGCPTGATCVDYRCRADSP